MDINATIIGQSIAFAVFVFFCLKFVWPPLITAMRERSEKIAQGLQAADQAEQDLELAKEKAADTLREAKQHPIELIDAALGGEEVIITENDLPVLKLVRVVTPKKRRQAGSAKGLVTLTKDFDAPLPDFEEY